MVKVVDSYLCGRGSIPGKGSSSLIVFLSMTSSLLLNSHNEQYIHIATVTTLYSILGPNYVRNNTFCVVLKFEIC